MPVSFASLPCRFAGYEVLRRLGTGGLASVYLARRLHGPAGLHVVRVVQPMLDECRRFHERLVAEAKLQSQVRNPHIVAVQELGEFEARPYVVLEYVQGISLAELQRHVGAPFLPRMALYVLAGILGGLAAAHSHQPLVIHGDLSPSNVLVGARGEIKLTDFSATSHSSASDWGVNTAYASPETMLGEPAGVSSDLFSAGVILWELLYGKRYHAREGREYRPPTPDEVIARPVPVVPSIEGMHGLDALLGSALAGFPRQRFASAEAFRSALADCVDPAGSAHQESDESAWCGWLAELGVCTWGVAADVRTL